MHYSPLGKPWVHFLAEEYTRCGFRFVPLVRKDSAFSCSLDILFLRRDNPGNLVCSGGDIDNRIKVLFDALRIIDNRSELGTANPIPAPGEDPFFCLLEDDNLITDVKITTDRLLVPVQSEENIHDVELVIHVKLTAPGALFHGDRLV